MEKEKNADKANMKKADAKSEGTATGKSAQAKADGQKAKTGKTAKREIKTKTDENSQLPQLKAGDEIKVFYRVIEGGKERIQIYEGTMIAIKNSGISRTITVRKTSFGIAVERIFPVNSKLIQKIEIKKHTKVRRAKLYLPERTEGEIISIERTQAMSDFAIESRSASGSLKLHLRHGRGGTGGLFGPVVAGAVILNPEQLNDEIRRLEKTSAGKRLKLARFIYAQALAYSLGWCWNDEIDRCNILQATKIAMSRPSSHLQIRPDYILLDGLDPAFLPVIGRDELIKGDEKACPSPPPRSSPRCSATNCSENFPDFFPHTTWPTTRAILPKNTKICYYGKG